MEANMDERSKEYALEYALILAVGALLLAIVIINLNTHFIA
jgi:Flp pilus assembly pilin Flp